MTRTDEARALGRQLRAARRLFADQIAAKVKAEELTDAEVADAADLFPDWVSGIAVSVGEVYRWDGTLVEVVQAHTTQADWTPDVVPALFKVHRTPDMTEWVAGISGMHPRMANRDRRIHLYSIDRRPSGVDSQAWYRSIPSSVEMAGS